MGRPPEDEPADLGERPLGRGEPDSLERLLGQAREALERQGEVGAALGAGDGVHFVDDHGLDAFEHLARL